MLKKSRYTKIIFTVGPATESREMLEAMIREGANICRLNMAHASHEWTSRVIGRIREASDSVGRHIPIMMDVKGPEIRTGDLEKPYELEKGELFDFICDPESTKHDSPDIKRVSVNYPKMNQDINVGDTILVDSGLIRLEAQEVLDDRVRGKVVIPGPLGNRRHINLPGIHIKLPCLTEKDKRDIAVGIENKVCFFALSFVRTADDLHTLREYLEEHGSDAKIIAKIEDQTAISKLHSIIRACDGLMVARGDLGIECPFEELPTIQKRAVKLCINQGKPVIVATHMLESMIENPIPTRAEITDVSNAVFEQADCVMLSGETTTGKYPLECIDAMKRITMQCEKHLPKGYNTERVLTNPRVKMLRSAALLAHELDDAGLVIFTRSGHLPRILSSLRPIDCPIFAFTDNSTVYKQLHILWGVEPFLLEFPDVPQNIIPIAINHLLRENWVIPEQWLVVITNTLVSSNTIESIQMRKAIVQEG